MQYRLQFTTHLRSLRGSCPLISASVGCRACPGSGSRAWIASPPRPTTWAMTTCRGDRDRSRSRGRRSAKPSPGRGPPPRRCDPRTEQLLIDDFRSTNEELRLGNYLFVDIDRKGRLLNDAHRFQPARRKALIREEMPQLGELSFEYWVGSASAFSGNTAIASCRSDAPRPPSSCIRPPSDSAAPCSSSTPPTNRRA